LFDVAAVAHDIVTIGASAGGVEALRKLFAALPGNFPGVISTVVHRSPFAVPSHLSEVLGLRTPHTIREPANGETLERGRIYLAPPDRHMRIAAGRYRLDRGPKQHFTRPAVDPLFETAAASYGPRVVGVVLSGGGDDGVRGLIAIKAAGGISIAQDPLEARVASMPKSAIWLDDVDLVLPLDEIARALVALATGSSLASLERSTVIVGARNH